MAEFDKLVITEAGQALITKLMVDGGEGLRFTKVATSSAIYTNETLAKATSLTGVKQTAVISSIEKASPTQVKLGASVENADVKEGYSINTLGLYATDTDDKEILYAACRALNPGYIPPYNGLSVSGAVFQLVVGVGVAEKVEMTVDPSVAATILDLKNHAEKIPADEGGVHGIRLVDGQVEIYDGSDWTPLQPLHKTYGVSIDLTNSNSESAVTYTDDAVGMVAGSSAWDAANIFKDIKPCVFKNGAVNYYLKPDDFTKKANGEPADITSGTDGDVMIEIPKVGVKISNSGSTLTVQITDDPNAGGFNYYAHTRDSEGDREKLYVGAFLGYETGSKLRSLSGKTPTANKTIGAFRTLAQANGAGYDQLSFYPLTLLQCLYLIRYKNLNSQAALGKGYTDTDNSEAINTGGTVSKGMNFGEQTGKQQMKFLGIEDFWGNLYYWIDGLYSTSDYKATTATKNFNDTGSGYSDKGKLSSSSISGYMKAPQGTNELGFIIKTGDGSDSTFFADYGYFYSDCLPCFGGDWDYGSDAGAFQLNVCDSASVADGYVGARLMYL